MTGETITDQLNALDEALFGERKRNLFDQHSPPFDVSRPNIHDSKREFLLELNAVQSIVDHTIAILDQVLGIRKDAEPEHQEMIKRLELITDFNAKQFLKSKTKETARDLARQNVIDTGFF